MEALVLAGLIGFGYLYNSKEENVDVTVNKELNLSGGNNVYNQGYYDETQKLIKSLAETNFEASNNEHSKIINNQKIYDNLKSIPQTNEKVEGMSNYVYSSASGEEIRQSSFLNNDQGIGLTPFFSGAGANINLDDNRKLTTSQGGNDLYKSKTEVGAFKEPEKDIGNVFGNSFGEYMGDKGRYNGGMSKKNELPFTQEQVSHIDTKLSVNGDIGREIANKQTIDNLRTINNPKLSYEGKILNSHSTIGKRGTQSQVFQHHPEKYYDNTSDKWFITNGAVLGESQRPEHILQETNRTFLNKQELGNAAPVNNESHGIRPSFKKSTKKQFGSDTVRNAGINYGLSSLQMHQDSYKSNPNEREVTELRTYDSNIKSGFNAPTQGLQDDLKSTVKETTINSKNNGFIQGGFANTMGLQDNVKNTKKQTTINSKNNGFISGGFNKLQMGYENQKDTVKGSTLFSYSGNAGAYVLGEISQDNYQNAITNPTKEIISQGRSPTINNSKIFNGGDTINMKVEKDERNYVVPRITGADKVYQETPTDQNCKLTNMKDRLEDIGIAHRINSDLLNPFKNNPYSQPLNSFAY